MRAESKAEGGTDAWLNPDRGIYQALMHNKARYPARAANFESCCYNVRIK
jgi:hypothetical protein